MEKTIAKHLLDIEAVFLKPTDPFTWASGIKSPIYCDNRLTLSYPKIRTAIENGLVDLIKENFANCEAVFGTSTAGIAHAGIVADKMELPMGYVRSSAKDHGRTNQIEGRVISGQKVVVVEDLISTGGSCVEVVNILREAGCEVLGVVSIFTYNMEKGITKLAENNVKNISLCNLDSLVEVAAEHGFIEQTDIQKILAFRENPSDIAWQNA
ncbi:MAG: orotate phosphoribosyltransferase [Bacillota bacterium]